MIINPTSNLSTVSTFQSSNKIISAETNMNAEGGMIGKPAVYFPAKIHSEVKKADSVSPVAKPSCFPYPTIDISVWMHPSTSTQQAKDQVVQAVLEQAISTGSFNITGHGISSDFFHKLDVATKGFFNLDVDEKNKFTTGNNNSGYVGMQQEAGSAVYHGAKENEKRDLREQYSCIYPPEHPENSHGPQQKTLDAYLTRVRPIEIALNHILSAALSVATGVDLPLDFIEQAKSGATAKLKTVRYSAMPKEYDDANRLIAHSDWGTFTVLYSSSPKGLEEIRDGKWVQVPFKPDELHVTIGELLTMWSNGLFTNNIHRVSNKAAANRVSYAYFAGQGIPDNGTSTSPVVVEGELPRFPPVSMSQHCQSYMKAIFGKS